MTAPDQSVTRFVLRVINTGSGLDVAETPGESKRTTAKETLAHVVACVNAHDELLAALRAAKYRLARMSGIVVGDKVTTDGIHWKLVTPDNLAEVRASILKAAP